MELPRTDGGTPGADGGGVVPGADGGATCDSPCACAEDGPPDFSREGDGRGSASSTTDQLAALRYANRFRSAAGLPAFDADARLEQAAAAHARYLSTNDEARCWADAHSESSSCTGFTGVSPGPRAGQAGYGYALVSEVIDWEGPEVSAAIDGWLWTVYHRRPFFEWQLQHVGFARQYGPKGDHQAWHNVMDFGRPRTGGTTQMPTALPVFPLPGQTGVPTAFKGYLEGPTPPFPDGGAWPRGVSSGVPVSMHLPHADWTVTDHALFLSEGAGCAPVPHLFVTRHTDPNLQARSGNELFIYANAPLRAGGRYVARIAGTLSGGPFTRTWAFTTR